MRRHSQDVVELISTLEATAEYWNYKVAKNEYSRKFLLFADFMGNLHSYFLCTSEQDHSHQPSIATTLIDLMDKRLIRIKRSKNKSEIRELIADNVHDCDSDIKELEKRSAKLFKSFTTLSSNALKADLFRN